VTGSEPHPEIAMIVNTLHVSFFNDMVSPFIFVEDVPIDAGSPLFLLPAEAGPEAYHFGRRLPIHQKPRELVHALLMQLR
jgi:hypothetical protein